MARHGVRCRMREASQALSDFITVEVQHMWEHGQPPQPPGPIGVVFDREAAEALLTDDNSMTFEDAVLAHQPLPQELPTVLTSIHQLPQAVAVPTAAPQAAPKQASSMPTAIKANAKAAIGSRPFASKASASAQASIGPKQPTMPPPARLMAPAAANPPSPAGKSPMPSPPAGGATAPTSSGRQTAGAVLAARREARLVAAFSGATPTPAQLMRVPKTPTRRPSWAPTSPQPQPQPAAATTTPQPQPAAATTTPQPQPAAATTTPQPQPQATEPEAEERHWETLARLREAMRVLDAAAAAETQCEETASVAAAQSSGGVWAKPDAPISPTASQSRGGVWAKPDAPISPTASPTFSLSLLESQTQDTHIFDQDMSLRMPDTLERESPYPAKACPSRFTRKLSLPVDSTGCITLDDDDF